MVWKPSLLQKGPRDSSWLLLHSWEQRKLASETTEIIAGGDVEKTILKEKGNFPVIANALTNDGVVGYYEYSFRVKAPAVTVTGRGDVGHAKARVVDFTPVVRLLSLKSRHDVFFMENAINNMRIVIESTGVPQLTVPQLSQYEIFYPQTILEEKKIGQFFRALDQLITLHQRVYFQRRKNKNCLRQKITFAWEQREFENFAQRKSEMGNSSSAPCVEYEDIIADQGRLNKDVFQKRSHKTGIKFSAGDVLFGKLRPYLKNWLLPDFSGVAVGDFWVLKPSGTDSRFLYYLIQTSEFFSVSNQSAGSKMPRADWNLVSQYAFHIPGEENEQQKIGSLFRRIDALITLHQREYLLFEVLLC